jgi:hypothetical protein
VRIVIQLKDPDTMQDAVDDAVKRLDKPEGVSAEEWADIREERAALIKSEIASRWMEYGEYLKFEVDTEAWTAKVLPAKG